MNTSVKDWAKAVATNPTAPIQEPTINVLRSPIVLHMRPLRGPAHGNSHVGTFETAYFLKGMKHQIKMNRGWNKVADAYAYGGQVFRNYFYGHAPLRSWIQTPH